MKMRFIVSSCVLLFFALLAGGSFDDIAVMFWIFLGVFAVVIIAAIILGLVKSNNKEKRLKMIKQDESNSGDFDRSISFGNDRCMFYFDTSKRQVMIMKVTTEGVKKIFVDGFEFSGKELYHQDGSYFCIYDAKGRYLLCGDYDNLDVEFINKDIAAEDKNNDIIPRNSIKANLIKSSITTSGITQEYIYTLVDECHGMMAIVRKGKISSTFNYINRHSITRKTGDKSFINYSCIGNNNFIMDEFFNVLVIVTPSSYRLFNYSDIIEVSYEENGTQLYSKSAMRTVGGAIVGGALMGGAGAVVGGLSGAAKKNMEIRTIDIKILLRSTQSSTCVLSFNDAKRILKTKEANDHSLYETYQKNANKAKDILSVIIDKAKQNTTVPIHQEVPKNIQKSSIADELTKLAKLKSDGILNEEEFNAQKAKLLNS